MDLTTAREIKHLKLVSLQYSNNNHAQNLVCDKSSSVSHKISFHSNCIQLYDVASYRDDLFLIFEYCEHDLDTLLHKFKYPFNEAEIKCLILQLLSGLEFLHSKGERLPIETFFWT